MQKKARMKTTHLRNRYILERQRRDAVQQREATAAAETRRLELTIAQLKCDLAERQQALFEIQAEREACQQILDVARTDYRRMRRHLKRQYPESEESDEDIGMSSDDSYDTDGAASFSMSTSYSLHSPCINHLNDVLDQ